MATRPTRIRRGRRVHLYIEEWMAYRGLNDQKLAGRLDPPVARETVFRWRKEQHRLNPEKISAIADALDIEPEDLYRPPPMPDAPPSLDALVRGESDDLKRMAADIVSRLVGKAS